MYISFFNTKDLQMKKLSLLVVVLGLATLAGCWKKKTEEVKPVESTPVTTEVQQPAAPVAPAVEQTPAPTAPVAPATPAATPVK